MTGPAASRSGRDPGTALKHIYVFAALSWGQRRGGKFNSIQLYLYSICSKLRFGVSDIKY